MPPRRIDSAEGVEEAAGSLAAGAEDPPFAAEEAPGVVTAEELAREPAGELSAEAA